MSGTSRLTLGSEASHLYFELPMTSATPFWPCARTIDGDTNSPAVPASRLLRPKTRNVFDSTVPATPIASFIRPSGSSSVESAFAPERMMRAAHAAADADRSVERQRNDVHPPLAQ